MIEKKDLKVGFVKDLECWASEHKDGLAVLIENEKTIEISCINKIVYGDSCYDTPQSTENLPSITHYDLSSYLKKFLISTDDFGTGKFDENQLIDFLDHWNNTDNFIRYEENEKIDEDYYYNYYNKVSIQIQVDELCDYLIKNPFVKPWEEFKKSFSHIKFDEVVSQHRAETLEVELNQKSIARKNKI